MSSSDVTVWLTPVLNLPLVLFDLNALSGKPKLLNLFYSFCWLKQGNPCLTSRPLLWILELLPFEEQMILRRWLLLPWLLGFTGEPIWANSGDWWNTVAELSTVVWIPDLYGGLGGTFFELDYFSYSFFLGSKVCKC